MTLQTLPEKWENIDKKSGTVVTNGESTGGHKTNGFVTQCQKKMTQENEVGRK